MRRRHRYLSERRNRPNYRRALAQDLPIGSGAIESAYRYIAQQRFERARAWWRVEHAEHMFAHQSRKRRLGRFLGRVRPKRPARRESKSAESITKIRSGDCIALDRTPAPGSPGREPVHVICNEAAARRRARGWEVRGPGFRSAPSPELRE